MANNNAGGIILALGVAGLGYALYKQGAFGKSKAGGVVAVPAVGAPVPGFPTFSAPPGIVGPGFGTTSITFGQITPGGSNISIFEPPNNPNIPEGTELPGED